ncbi:MAG: hypothetical protein U0X20_22130 [Caldilineaceae bacterium]
MMELMTGEAGVLRTALGVVLGRVGIDVRVRVYLWSGGVEDVVLPTMGAQPYPVGAQVIVQFLSDRTASGMVLGAIEGLLSWRRVEAPAFTERMQPYLQETAAKCGAIDETVTVIENIYAPAEMAGLSGGVVAMADGRVFLIPGQAGTGLPVIPPMIWDPYTGALHEVAMPWTEGDGTDLAGGCLLQDGRVFFMPAWGSTVGQAYIYDPELDRVVPAGAAVATGYGGCALMADGRVLLTPCSGVTSPLIYDPRADTMTASAAVVPEELQTGSDYGGAQLLPDGRVLLVPFAAPKPLIYDPDTDSLAAVDVDLGGNQCGGAVLLPDGRVLITIASGSGMTVVFDPATDSCSVTTPPSHPGVILHAIVRIGLTTKAHRGFAAKVHRVVRWARGGAGWVQSGRFAAKLHQVTA